MDLGEVVRELDVEPVAWPQPAVVEPMEQPHVEEVPA